MRFLLLTESDDHFLENTLTEILKPLGSLSVSRVKEDVWPDTEEPYGLIFIDATTVDRPERWVAHLRLERPERRIVVLTASPTWQRARAAIEAGAMDYLPQTLSAEELLKAFRLAMKKTIPR